MKRRICLFGVASVSVSIAFSSKVIGFCVTCLQRYPMTGYCSSLPGLGRTDHSVKISWVIPSYCNINRSPRRHFTQDLYNIHPQPSQRRMSTVLEICCSGQKYNPSASHQLLGITLPFAYRSSPPTYRVDPSLDLPSPFEAPIPPATNPSLLRVCLHRQVTYEGAERKRGAYPP